jgi:SAM-dependent methyltransferase
MNPSFYDYNYFMCGIESRKSCYQNFRWIPELTIPMVMTMIDLVGIKRHDTVLEVGCAKGYIVKAFRMLYRYAFGIDISRYAIDNVDPDVKEYCSLVQEGDIPSKHFDCCIAKDVLEHISYEDIVPLLSKINASKLFCVIPLGKDKKYFAPANDFDLSHQICENSDWWISALVTAGWKPVQTWNRVPGIKDSYEEGTHGFFLARK